MKSEEDILNQLRDEVAQRAAEDFTDQVERVTARCESPIERVLVAALIIENEGVGFQFMGSGESGPLVPYEAACSHSYLNEKGLFYIQPTIGEYRSDLALEVFDRRNKESFLRIVIECDGHDFHERTKEQARRDKRRDRWFQTRGIGVLRFTGSEIWSDPRSCAEQVYDLFWAASNRRDGRG